MIIQISAGQGPAECQLAVAKLVDALKKEYGDIEIISKTNGYENGCYDSIRFRTQHDFSGLEGGFAKARLERSIKERTGTWI